MNAVEFMARYSSPPRLRERAVEPEPVRCARCGAAGFRTADRHDGARWRTVTFACCADLLQGAEQ